MAVDTKDRNRDLLPSGKGRRLRRKRNQGRRSPLSLSLEDSAWGGAGIEMVRLTLVSAVAAQGRDSVATVENVARRGMRGRPPSNFIKSVVSALGPPGILN